MKTEIDCTIIKQLKLIYIFISLAFTYLVFKSDIFLEILNGKINYIILFVLYFIFSFISPFLIFSFLERKIEIVNNKITIIDFFGARKRTFEISKEKPKITQSKQYLKRPFYADEKYYNFKIISLKTVSGKTINIRENITKNFSTILKKI